MALPPIIEALLRRSQYGVSKINARGNAISAALQPFAGNVGRYYAPIQANEQSVGNALSSSLTAQGQQLGSGISQTLGLIQAPGAAVQQFGAGTATTGQQAGQAVGALSSADLQRLQAQGSAEQIYAAALPRLAQLAADQDRRAFLADAAQELGDLAAQQAQTDTENQRYAAQQSRQAMLDRRDQLRYRASQRQNARDTAYARRQQKIKNVQTKRALDAAIGKDQASLSEKTWYDKQKADTARFNAMTSAQRASISGQNLQERIRHDKAMEENQAKSKAGKGGGQKLWDSTRDDVFRRAQTYGKSYKPSAVLKSNRGVDKATARARLWHEFGTLLTSRGFDRQAVNTLISNALAAAGY